MFRFFFGFIALVVSAEAVRRVQRECTVANSDGVCKEGMDLNEVDTSCIYDLCYEEGIPECCSAMVYYKLGPFRFAHSKPLAPDSANDIAREEVKLLSPGEDHLGGNIEETLSDKRLGKARAREIPANDEDANDEKVDFFTIPKALQDIEVSFIFNPEIVDPNTGVVVATAARYKKIEKYMTKSKLKPGDQILEVNALEFATLSSEQRDMLKKGLSGRALTFKCVRAKVGDALTGDIKESLLDKADPTVSTSELPAADESANDGKVDIFTIPKALQDIEVSFIFNPEIVDPNTGVVVATAARYKKIEKYMTKSKLKPGDQILEVNALEFATLSSEQRDMLKKGLSGRTLTFKCVRAESNAS